MKEHLYPPTKSILAACDVPFDKIEPHGDEDDSESNDLLWLEFSPEDKFSDGEVICIAPFGVDNKWVAIRYSAFKVGRWATYWDTSGTESEVVSRVLNALNTK